LLVSILEAHKLVENNTEKVKYLTYRVADLEETTVNKSSIDQMIGALKIEQNIRIQGNYIKKYKLDF